MGFALSEPLAEMCQLLKHRGPDSEGTWADLSSGVGLAHSRLAVLDLSELGSQPMVSPSNRYVLVLNGEIYNHRQIRDSLTSNMETPDWKGHSDTESLLALIDTVGPVAALERLVGMFAFAVWDRELKLLTLARDRFGEKPLYYGNRNGVLVFGSDLSVFSAVPGFPLAIDTRALALFMRYSYVPSPFSIYLGVKKLGAGEFLQVSPNEIESGHLNKAQKWWSPQISAESFDGDDADAISTLTDFLRTSVKQQMLSDVPIGSFLSGGIDSSIITALMQENSSKPVKTFSIGFQEQRFNEAPFAKAVADNLGTDHTEMIITDRDAASICFALSEVYSEPFADGSQIPTIAVSQLARGDVAVALTGDGGDELFGGYRRYLDTLRIWARVQKVPPAARSLIEKNIGSSGLKSRGKVSFKLATLARLAGARSESELYKTVMSVSEPADILRFPEEHAHELDSTWQDGIEMLSAMMLTDLQTYLVDDLLVKVDRAGMNFGLETRMPFLDLSVANFALSLPVDLKVRNQETKWLLRQVLSNFVPAPLFERPKKGFSAPIETWLRSPAFQDWVESNLSTNQLEKAGFFNTTIVQKMFTDHLAGTRNWQGILFNIVVFQDWLERQHP